jgi:hypothetical protein
MKNAHSTLVLLLAALMGTSCQPEPPEPAPQAPASIRDTDFRNFSYAFGQTSFTLRDSARQEVRNENDIVEEMGYFLDDVIYGDVTGDGSEDAIVVVEGVTGGSAIPHYVFVYSSGPGGPRRLWSFETGDRSAGGLKGVSVQDGRLVVELYGKDKVPSDPESLWRDDGTDSPACCPSMFTRSVYAWNGRAFELHGAPQALPYDPQSI